MATQSKAKQYKAKVDQEQSKSKLPDQTKITSILILFYGIFKKCLAFLKQNRKDSYVFVLIWRVLGMAEGKTEIIWWTWQKKMDLYIPWKSQSQIKVLLDVQRSQGRISDLQEKQILQQVCQGNRSCSIK